MLIVERKGGPQDNVTLRDTYFLLVILCSMYLNGKAYTTVAF